MVEIKVLKISCPDSNAPISSVIRTASATSMLTRMHRCHPHTLTLVVTKYRDRMFFLYRNKLCHWFIKDLATWTTRKCGINWRCWNHNRNVYWTLWSTLLRNAWLGIGLEIRRVVQRLIGILKLRLSSVNLEGMTSVFLQLERSEPTTWEVTSAQVQKHNLSTMLSK